jgi:hypothetical protein
MEYRNSLSDREAENETSAREGKRITISEKHAEIEQFKQAKTVLEDKLKAIALGLKSTEVNQALKEITTGSRAQWDDLLSAQFKLYAYAKQNSKLEFDMWFDNPADAYLWTDARQTTDEAIEALLLGNYVPVDETTLTCTR